MFQYVQNWLQNTNLQMSLQEYPSDDGQQLDRKKELRKAANHIEDHTAFLWNKRVRNITPPKPRTDGKKENALERFILFGDRNSDRTFEMLVELSLAGRFAGANDSSPELAIKIVNSEYESDALARRFYRYRSHRLEALTQLKQADLQKGIQGNFLRMAGPP